MKLVRHTNYHKSPAARTPVIESWVGFKRWGDFFVVRIGWHEWEWYVG